ncbi:hypothetical protein OIO90_006259 [Microbotryomycetes sp. JL221]|nr:hypothetical protein OIO90_006259 [Microbotryomycetes sp. JL221]
MLATRWPSPVNSLIRCVRQQQPQARSVLVSRQLCSTTRTLTPRSTNFLNSYRLVLGASLSTLAVGVGMSSTKSPLLCAVADRSYAMGSNEPLPVAESSINVRDLSFGTVSGICVGVFIKKGLKAIAFMLGGAFIFLQYMSSRSFVTVNWNAVSSTYDSFITKHAGPNAAAQTRQPGNRLAGVTNTFVDFVTANVQSRATFVLGMMLGLRLG